MRHQGQGHACHLSLYRSPPVELKPLSGPAMSESPPPHFASFFRATIAPRRRNLARMTDHPAEDSERARLLQRPRAVERVRPVRVLREADNSVRIGIGHKPAG